MFLVVGSTTVDLFVNGVERLPGWDGEEFAVSNLAFCDEALRLCIGGNGANSAYILARLGAAVRLVSAAGRDEMGSLVLGWLSEAGVDCSHFVRSDHLATATTVLVMDRRRNRMIFHHPGAYPAVNIGDMADVWSAGTRFLLINGFPLMHGLRSQGYERLLRMARSEGAVTAVDIGPAIGEVTRAEEIAPLLPLIDYLITNSHELSQCVDAPSEEDRLRVLLDHGAERIILKQGEAGSQLVTRVHQTHVPAIHVDTRQTVGAGDAYDAGFLWGLSGGSTEMEAMRLGSACAALVVASERGVMAAPSQREVLELAEKGSAERSMQQTFTGHV
jgi:sugar/nucleoside kinase (ribokinase family)